MPFTLSHPAAVLPIWLIFRKRLTLGGLIVGSVVPDIGYFLFLEPSDNAFRHTTAGLMTVGIIEGICLYIMVFVLFYQPMSAIIPSWIVQRCVAPKIDGIKPSEIITIITSIALGAETHIIWDGFSHESGWFVEHSELLRCSLGPFHIYKRIQYLSSVVGLIILGLWSFGRLIQSEGRSYVREFFLVRTIMLIWLGIGSVTVLYITSTLIKNSVSLSVDAIVVKTVISSISGFITGVLIYSIGYWITWGRVRKRKI